MSIFRGTAMRRTNQKVPKPVLLLKKHLPPHDLLSLRALALKTHQISLQPSKCHHSFSTWLQPMKIHYKVWRATLLMRWKCSPQGTGVSCITRMGYRRAARTRVLKCSSWWFWFTHLTELGPINRVAIHQSHTLCHIFVISVNRHAHTCDPFSK